MDAYGQGPGQRIDGLHLHGGHHQSRRCGRRAGGQCQFDQARVRHLRGHAVRPGGARRRQRQRQLLHRLDQQYRQRHRHGQRRRGADRHAGRQVDDGHPGVERYIQGGRHLHRHRQYWHGIGVHRHLRGGRRRHHRHHRYDGSIRLHHGRRGACAARRNQQQSPVRPHLHGYRERQHADDHGFRRRDRVLRRHRRGFGRHQRRRGSLDEGACVRNHGDPGQCIHSGAGPFRGGHRHGYGAHHPDRHGIIPAPDGDSGRFIGAEPDHRERHLHDGHARCRTECPDRGQYHPCRPPGRERRRSKPRRPHGDNGHREPCAFRRSRHRALRHGHQRDGRLCLLQRDRGCDSDPERGADGS